MKRPLPLLPLVLLGLLAFPPHASANAGTPLMWALTATTFFGPRSGKLSFRNSVDATQLPCFS